MYYFPKCCYTGGLTLEHPHSDIDILCHWFSPEAPSRVSSFGSLTHFRKEAKPPAAGSATRCLECPYETDCAYSAKRSEHSFQFAAPLLSSADGIPVYLDPVAKGHKGWPADILVDGLPDIENITQALRTGPYGRCVYESDNDVCDNQVSHSSPDAAFPLT